jgi:hypothetical protein
MRGFLFQSITFIGPAAFKAETPLQLKTRSYVDLPRLV